VQTFRRRRAGLSATAGLSCTYLRQYIVLLMLILVEKYLWLDILFITLQVAVI